jgi:hypothetical protein
MSCSLFSSILQFLVSHVKLDFEPIKTFPIVPRESFFMLFNHWTSGLKLGKHTGHVLVSAG